MAAPLNDPIYLKAREILPIENGAGLEVKCLRGTLWITQSGDPEDIIIDSGPMISPMPGASTSIAATVLPSSFTRM